MAEVNEYESDLRASREEIAAVLEGVVDGVLAGSIRLGAGKDAVIVATPEEIDLEIELEAEDGEMSLELELTWPDPNGEVPGGHLHRRRPGRGRRRTIFIRGCRRRISNTGAVRSLP